MNDCERFLYSSRRSRAPVLIMVACFWLSSGGLKADEYAAERTQMLREIDHTYELHRSEVETAGFSGDLRKAMGSVPRHVFVPEERRHQAYENRPVPIGHGQTISQPYIVALMTDLAGVEPGDTVLEIGTGSGYQAAVLAEMGVRVFSIEIIEPLGMSASTRLGELGYKNVEVRIGDGYFGWEEHAPFDAILVTAAASHIPPPLVRQLKPGGRMVIPVGSRLLTQHLVMVEKDSGGEVFTRQLLPVRFVPLTGNH